MAANPRNGKTKDRIRSLSPQRAQRKAKARFGVTLFIQSKFFLRALAQPSPLNILMTGWTGVLCG
jgi:hypothetical protein